VSGCFSSNAAALDVSTVSEGSCPASTNSAALLRRRLALGFTITANMITTASRTCSFPELKNPFKELCYSRLQACK
jgi:hypothetical protein